MKDDCCQHVIVLHKRRRKFPRVTEKDFEALRQIQARIDEIGRENDETNKRLESIACVQH